jgi:hypothetical protein
MDNFSTGDIRNPTLLYVKGAMFVIGGILASAEILVAMPTLRIAILLAIAIWCFARAYYFVFYVIEHYADPGYRFAGLWSFVWYLLQKKRRQNTADTDRKDR